MSPTVVGIIGLCVFFLLLALRMPIGFAMGLVGFGGFVYLKGLDPGLSVLGIVPYSTMSNYVFATVALFVLMGNFAYRGGLTTELYKTAYAWLGAVRGGLAMTTVASCAGFAAVSGSSIATAATMGAIALPEMKRYNYHPALATGAIAAGGTIGILIPPSIPLILYGMITEQSIGKLFMGGLFPGILEAVFYIIAIYIVCRLDAGKGPQAPSVSFKEKLAAARGIWGMLALILLVLGGIYTGIFTPGEAGAIGAFGALLLMAAKGRFTWQNLAAAFLETGRTVGMIFFIVVGTFIFGYFLSITQIPISLANFVAGLPAPPYAILAATLFIYIILGCFIESLGMLLLTVPIFFPVIMALGYDPIWFGIIVVRVMEIALITPPVGMNVYVIKGIAKDVPLSTIFRGILPFFIADICHLTLLLFVPQLVLFLPSLMR